MYCIQRGIKIQGHDITKTINTRIDESRINAIKKFYCHCDIPYKLGWVYRNIFRQAIISLLNNIIIKAL